MYISEEQILWHSLKGVDTNKIILALTLDRVILFTSDVAPGKNGTWSSGSPVLSYNFYRNTFVILGDKLDLLKSYPTLSIINPEQFKEILYKVLLSSELLTEYQKKSGMIYSNTGTIENLIKPLSKEGNEKINNLFDKIKHIQNNINKEETKNEDTIT